MLENVPLRNIVPSLVALAMTLGPLLADSVSPIAEGCSDWTDGLAAPFQAQIQREMEILREHLVSSVPGVVQRRLQMLQYDGVRFGRRLHGVILCIYDLLL